MDLEVLNFDLLRLLDDFADTMALRAHEKDLNWTAECAGMDRSAHADKSYTAESISVVSVLRDQ